MDKSSKSGFNIAALFILLTKLGGKLAAVFIKLLKGAKVVKVGLAGASAATYTLLFSWKFALAIMALLFIHESGHVWAMRKCGIKTKGFYFIPLLGGAAVAEESFKTRRNETYVALMGPVWGLLLALISGVVYVLTENPVFAAAASWMSMINLVNLLPVNPLDGGRILKSICFSVNSTLGLAFLIIGLAIAIFLFFWAGVFIFSILLFVGALEFFMEYKNVRTGSPGYVEEETLKRKEYMAQETFYDLKTVKSVKKYLNGLPEDERPAAAEALKNAVDNRVMNTPLLLAKPVQSDIVVNPRMTGRQILGYSLCTGAVVGCFFAVMSIMNHVPEATLARSVLFETPAATNSVTNATSAVSKVDK